MKPDKPGWYWTWSAGVLTGKGHWTIRRVFRQKKELVVQHMEPTGGNSFEVRYIPLELFKVDEWAGPIEEPK